MRWIYRIAAVVILLLGAAAIASDIPTLVTGGHDFLEFPGLAAVVGLWLSTTAALNLLNDRYGADAPGLRTVTIIIDSLGAIIVARIVSLGGGDWTAYLALAMLILLPILAALLARQPRRQRRTPAV